MRKVFLVVLVCLGVSILPLFSMSKQELLTKVRKYRENREHAIIGEFLELLSIPNVAADKKNIRKNAEHIKKLLLKRGIDSRILETAGNPVVYGELKVPGAKRTLLYYVHYDGQPVDQSKWTGSLPFKPVLRPGKLEAGSNRPVPMPLPPKGKKFNEEWRLYGRSTSDDKAPVIALMTALDAIKYAGVPLKNNLKFIFEGEEEAGSTNLGSFLKKYKELLKSDLLLMCDGPGYFSGAPTFIFGVRGITSIRINVYGAYGGLHSGHYGNWAPNPALQLSKLLASMKDDKGNVAIDGFYDTVTPLSALELKALQEIPGYDDHLKKLYGFSVSENPDKSLMESILLPSLNVAGLRSGWVGEQTRTVIPPDAEASIDIRLVKGNDPKDMVDKVIRHIKKQGYHVLNKEPGPAERQKHRFLARVTRLETGYRASRTSMDLPVSIALQKAIARVHKEKPVLMPSLGGSLPIYLFEEALRVPVIGIPIANFDNNQHQQDENIRIGHLWKAIETFAAVMMME